MRRVGGYSLSTRLASGSLGDVFLARPVHDRAAEESAVKLIRTEFMADLRFARLFMAERPTAEGFRHPNAVSIRKIERINNDAAVEMELLAGQPLGAVAQRSRIEHDPLPHRLAAWIGAKVASALIEAHQTPWFSGSPAPMVHGALAPRSVFLTYSGQVYLLGLGLGRARHVVPPSSSRLPYLAPEIIQGRDLTTRTDVYGLAVVLYEAFTGRSLFRRASPEATRAAVLQANVPRLNARNLDIDPDIGDLLADMMAPRPAARPEDLVAAQEALLAAAGSDDAGFQRSLATIMRARFREEQEAFQRQIAVANRQPGSQVISGIGPVAAETKRPSAPASVVIQSIDLPSDDIDVDVDMDGDDGEPLLITEPEEDSDSMIDGPTLAVPRKPLAEEWVSSPPPAGTQAPAPASLADAEASAPSAPSSAESADALNPVASDAEAETPANGTPSGPSAPSETAAPPRSSFGMALGSGPPPLPPPTHDVPEILAPDPDDDSVQTWVEPTVKVEQALQEELLVPPAPTMPLSTIDVTSTADPDAPT
ncbi:MAG: serine/threonine-protein kinase, partial [Myxococcota bacterium]